MQNEARGTPDLGPLESARDADELRLTDEQRARQVAERALDHLARLQQVTTGLAEAMTSQEVAQIVVEQSIAAMGACSGRLALLRPDGVTIDVVAAAGYKWVRSPINIDEPIPSTEVIRTGQPIFANTFAEVEARYPGIPATVDPLILGGSASVPLFGSGRPIGAMTIVFEGDRTLELDDRDLLTSMAQQCSQALERARLYELSLTVQEDVRRSRDQLAAILGGIAEGVTVQDASGRLVFANAVAAQLSGYASPDEFISASHDIAQRFELFDEFNKPVSFDQLPGRRVLRGEESVDEMVVQYLDRTTGERKWSILDATPVRDENGKVQLVVTIFRDITDRKRQTDATEILAAAGTILADSLDVEPSLQQIAELAVPRIADWVVIDMVHPDPERRARRVAVAHANTEDEAVAAWFRRRLPAVGGFVDQVWRTGRGQLIEDWPAAFGRWDVRDDERRRLFEAIAPKSWIVVPLIARGSVFGSITLATAHSGRRFTKVDFELAEDLGTRVGLAIDNARLYREAQEQAEHQSVLNVALRETIEERDRALLDQQQALRTRDEFLASASHDLKNPLASIKATAQLLERRIDRPGPVDVARLHEGLQRIDAIASRAAGLVEELLDLARMQMGAPLDLDRRKIDLIDLTREVIRERHAAESHSIEMLGAARIIGAWDARRLGRVLSNLVDNAIKYSPAGGAVTVRAELDGSWAVLEVSDHGVGIPAEDQARIFERFQRASNVAGRISGTGIGLASARHIVESHGGTITVTSTEGDGSTFTVRLPIEPADDP
jgi:PAS domain S-box-containing protein